MINNKTRINKKGFSLLEALLALSIFALVVTVLAGGLTYSQQSAAFSGLRVQASLLAEEGLEAARSMRDEDFNLLATGTHGLVDSGGTWNFSGNSDTTEIFTRSITVSDIDSETKLVTANVTWQQTGARSGSVELSTRITNWKAYNPTQADQLTVDVSNVDVGGQGNREILGMTIEDTGIEDITIVSTEISWSGVPANRLLEEIIIDGGSVWTGSDASGETQDISDFTLVLGAGSYPMDLLFSGALSGISVTITFNMEDGSNKQISFEPGVPPDIIPPDDIVDLTASSPTNVSLDLDWTAPGDDASTGTATSYDIRYSTSTIDDSNWGSATQVSGEPTPSVAGTSESMTVAGLLSNTTYYFAIKTSDEVPNTSGLSNIAIAATLGAPQANYLIVNTTGMALSSNNKNIIGITLQNSGPSDITISSIATNWSGVAASRRMNAVSVNGITVWNGAVASGTTSDVNPDIVLVSGAAVIPIDYFRFNGNIIGIIFSVTFNMTDGSSKTVSGLTPL